MNSNSLVSDDLIAQNLIRVSFLLRERMKKLCEISDFKAQHIHVIGAGTMGGGIATWCAFKGLKVTLQDKEEKLITSVIRRAQLYFEKTLNNPAAIVAAMDKLIADTHGEGIANADIVIESIFENLEMKQELLQRIETQIKPSAFMATNTSSLLLEDIGKPLQDRSRLVGMHFVKPVTEMQLVELRYSANN